MGYVKFLGQEHGEEQHLKREKLESLYYFVVYILKTCTYMTDLYN
jgi:hypothetical protein